jgi:hypothetical protein
MRSFRKQKTELYLGSETDTRLYSRLMAALETLGAEKFREETIRAGSQELMVIGYRIECSKVFVEIETYSGITISGERFLVEQIASICRVGEGAGRT